MVNGADMLDAARLIGVDWGSTGLRVFLIGDAGVVLAMRQSALGASAMNGDAWAYQRTLEDHTRDWLAVRPDLRVLACGMVGSQHGWREAPYVACPADAAALIAQALAMAPGVRIVPGLLHRPENGPPDVMRGEETQIVGALQLCPRLVPASCVVLPGTHSKWAQVDAGRVLGFSTWMTGELFALLRQHSVIGRLMPEATQVLDEAAFARGVDEARRATWQGLTHQLFSVRTLGLLQRLPASALPDYLSGLLIGHELRHGLAWRGQAGLQGDPLAIVGEPALCRRYHLGLQRIDATVQALVLDNTAPVGLWKLAQAGRTLDAPA